MFVTARGRGGVFLTDLPADVDVPGIDELDSKELIDAQTERSLQQYG